MTDCLLDSLRDNDASPRLLDMSRRSSRSSKKSRRRRTRGSSQMSEAMPPATTSTMETAETQSVSSSVSSSSSSLSETDRKLIAELRSRIADELKLFPSYDHDISLLRWLIGWNRDVDVVVPKLTSALRQLHALGLHKTDFSSLEAVKEFVDNVSKPSWYMPGSLIGYDKDGNVVSLQAVGRIDNVGCLHSAMMSDIFLMRIAESEGVMHLIREKELRAGRQFGTTVIIDCDGISWDTLDWTIIKSLSHMLGKLQELFPDVLRKLYVIRAPSFMHLIWAAIYPVLSKQTQNKIEFLGADWKEKIHAHIDPAILYSHWGGTKPSETPFGDIRIGGKVPLELYYDAASDPFATMPDAKKVNVGARTLTFVPIQVKGGIDPKRTLTWWWRCDSGDLDFGVRKAAVADKSKPTAEESDDEIMWPKWRLLTQYVPEHRTISIPNPGLYKLVFDNSHGKIWSKTVKYHVVVNQ